MIVCQCNVTTSEDFKKSAEIIDQNPNESVRKTAGKLLLNARSGKACVGQCSACLPEIRKIVDDHRKRQSQVVPPP